MNKETKLAAAAAVTAVVGAVAAGAAYATTKLLVETALDRNAPRLVQRVGPRISGAVMDPAIEEKIKAAEETLLRAETEAVELEASDGTPLAGHWYPCEHAKRAVIAMHGWRSSWSRDFGVISGFLHQNGCSVLFAEQRGQNGSGGEYMGFGLTERYDCLDWVKWVSGRAGPELPIYLCGISMGATTVLMAAGLGLPDNVRGIISDCGFTSPEDIWRHVANKNLHISYSLRKALIESMYSRRLHVEADDYSTLDALAATRTPVLFIHGTDDHFVPVEMTYENYKACASQKSLFVVPGADHGMSYFTDPPGYRKAVQGFWAENDMLQNTGNGAEHR